MTATSAPARRKAVVALFVTAALAATLVAAGTTARPAGALPVTVSSTPIASDLLDGTGLSVLQVGTTVYVGGTFATVRDQAGTTTTSRANLAAFDVATGHLITTFRADTYRAVRSLATDGTRLFVAGSFTTEIACRTTPPASK